MVRVAVRTAKANAGAVIEGSNGDEAAARRAYATSIANDPKAVMSAARRAHTRAAVHTAEAKAGAVDKGSDGDEAAASATRQAYAVSGLANDPKAAMSATRRTCTATGIEEEADNTGVDKDEVASGGRHRPTTATTVADVATVNNNEATNGGRRRAKTITGRQRRQGHERRAPPAHQSRAYSPSDKRRPHEQRAMPGPTRTPTLKPTGGHSRWVPADKLASPRDPTKKRPLGSRVTAGEPPME
jgi:hypothetical protein